MIKVLGTKRVLMIVFLVAINVAFAAGVYVYLVPEITAKERELGISRGQISTLQSDISRLEIEFDQLEEQQAEFNRLQEKGFFGAQGRREAELVLEKIQKQAGVVSAVANIKAGELQENEEAAKAEYIILSSPVEVKIEALDDVDVFKYIYLVEQFFPGHVAVTNIDLERKMDVSGPVLRSIASGSNLTLVEATVQMVWRTMIPKTDVINQGAVQ